MNILQKIYKNTYFKSKETKVLKNFNRITTIIVLINVINHLVSFTNAQRRLDFEIKFSFATCLLIILSFKFSGASSMFNLDSPRILFQNPASGGH